ncbi:MAG: hypothetical protein HUU20_02945 [Pirellulales bacterium]|nr:hypothetical protein [Pirellulales bacterium]
MRQRSTGNPAVHWAIILLALQQAAAAVGEDRTMKIVVSPAIGARATYGVEQLQAALQRLGYRVDVERAAGLETPAGAIRVGTASQSEGFRKMLGGQTETEEGFALAIRPDRSAVVAGAGDAGALYGCLELAERLEAAAGQFPEPAEFRDAPKLRLRGPCLGLQRPEPGMDGSRYDYCYLPETFPWFYDRAVWIKYLDLLAQHRFNAVYLWNGHPFTSILKLPKYPDAQEVATPQLEANIELFRWLTAEADRRNIWIIQNCYNIHISHAMARSRKLPFAHRKPSPLVDEYMAYCIGQFVREYPHVGLMMCLGEDLDDRYDVDWYTRVVIPAVRGSLQDGQPLPPLVVRSHSTPIFELLGAAKPLYPNLYVESKYNNETLASDEVGGGTDPVTTRHYAFEKDGDGHRRLAQEAFLVTNIHCVANLEPFRWGSPDFVRRAVRSCVGTGVKGLHLYPLRYWEWPYSADRAEPRLLQLERDWIWFAGWARYAWNCDRDQAAEEAFWTRQFAAKYGSPEAGRFLLDAYERSGEVMPRVVRSFAVTSENYLASTLGQTLPQLFASKRWYSPPGETVAQYAENEAAGRTHLPENPLAAAESLVRDGEAALAAARKAQPLVTRNQAEFERVLSDTEAVRLVAHFYRHKVSAAADGLTFVRTRDLARLERCVAELARSVEVYRELAALCGRAYLDCAGRHDPGRRYPYPAPKYLVWSDVLPEFEAELALVRRNAEKVLKDRQAVSTRELSETFFTEPIR